MARELDTNSMKNRSAVSNGTSMFLEDVDGRKPIARRYRDLVDDFSQMVGGKPNVAQEALIRRIATMALQCEIDECSLANGETFDSDRYARRANIMSALIARLGLARMAKDGSGAKVIDAHTAALAEGA